MAIWMPRDTSQNGPRIGHSCAVQRTESRGQGKDVPNSGARPEDEYVLQQSLLRKPAQTLTHQPQNSAKISGPARAPVAKSLQKSTQPCRHLAAALLKASSLGLTLDGVHVHSHGERGPGTVLKVSLPVT